MVKTWDDPMFEKKSRLVIADDDAQRRQVLTQHVQAEGYSVLPALDEAHVLDQLQTTIPDLLLLAMTFGGGEGIQFCQRVRACSTVPLLLLVRERQEQIHGLNAGADDCLICPFRLPELLARIRALLRRAHGVQRPGPPGPQMYTFGPMTIDVAQYAVRIQGREVPLTPLEYRLLLVLAQNAGWVVSTEHLLRVVWGPHAPADHHLVQVTMARLRRKVESDPGCPCHIRSKRGCGYVLSVPSARQSLNSFSS